MLALYDRGDDGSRYDPLYVVATASARRVVLRPQLSDDSSQRINRLKEQKLEAIEHTKRGEKRQMTRRLGTTRRSSSTESKQTCRWPPSIVKG